MDDLLAVFDLVDDEGTALSLTALSLTALALTALSLTALFLSALSGYDGYHIR